jgi:hypothetical protein
MERTLKQYSVKDLCDYCKNKGFVRYSKLKKNDLITMIIDNLIKAQIIRKLNIKKWLLFYHADDDYVFNKESTPLKDIFPYFEDVFSTPKYKKIKY